jgi:hypothetical protein
MLPAAIEWSSRNGAFFVLGNCAFPCNYGGLTLFEHDAVSGAWKTLASWDSPIAGRHIQTLELLDPGHLAVGPIEGHIHVVSLDAPTQSRVLLPETAFRLSRRP